MGSGRGTAPSVSPRSGCAHAPAGCPAARAVQAARSNDGFTIGEVLITVALVGLLTLAVAAGIGVAINAYNDIRSHAEAQAVLNNAVTAVTDELRFAYDVEAVDGADAGAGLGAAWAFDSSIRGYRLFLGNEAGAEGTVIILNAVTAEPTGSVVEGEKVPLPLADTAATDNSAASTLAFTAKLTSLAWDEATRTWTYSIEVTNGTTTVSTKSLTVRPVNNW